MTRERISASRAAEARSAVEQEDGRTRQTGETIEPNAARIGQHPPVSLEEACAIVDGWDAGFAPFPLHQMCRVLREEIIRQTSDAACWAALAHARGETIADLTAHLRPALGHRPAGDQALAAGAVWLLRENRSLRDANDCWQRFADRAHDEIPCARPDPKKCGLRDYPWAPCCKLRGAAWFGDPFPTDYLPEEGYIHLFHPPDPACPNAPRRSAGCVKLVGFDA